MTAPYGINSNSKQQELLMFAIKKQNQGFTLVELLVSIGILGILLSAAGMIFSSQQKVHTLQEQMVDLEQSLRGGLSFMEREIRMAGYDEYPKKPADAGFIAAGPSLVNFTMSIHNNRDDDLDGIVDEWDEAGSLANNGRDDDGSGATDGYDESAALGNADTADPNEDITYGFDPVYDADGDGIADQAVSNPLPGAAPLGRVNILNGNYVDLIENVEAVSFAYAFDDDMDGWIDFTDGDGDGVQGVGEPTLWAIDTDADGFLDMSLDTNGDGQIDINDAAGGVALPSTVSINRIRSVQMWILARVEFEDRQYQDTNTYVLGNKRLVRNDNFRRRFLNTTIRTRNVFPNF
jgi:prepilin-type N-terminal cleavage/methylation domain-containing protein